jgi:hypothetical protein
MSPLDAEGNTPPAKEPTWEPFTNQPKLKNGKGDISTIQKYKKFSISMPLKIIPAAFAMFERVT